MPVVALALATPLAPATTPRPGGPKGVAGLGRPALRDSCAARASVRPGRTRATKRAGCVPVAAACDADQGAVWLTTGACSPPFAGSDRSVEMECSGTARRSRCPGAKIDCATGDAAARGRLLTAASA